MGRDRDQNPSKKASNLGYFGERFKRGERWACAASLLVRV
jgi:hypothetical protein